MWKYFWRPPDVPSSIIVIWDIENVRIPHSMCPGTVIDMVRRKFVSTFASARVVCCVTSCSLRAIERALPTFTRDAVPRMEVRVAAGYCPKLGADYVLRTAMAEFMELHAASAHSACIVLLTGDADFIEPLQRAARVGFDVKLVHCALNSSRALVESCSGVELVEWSRLLADELNGGVDVEMPYITQEAKDAAIQQQQQAAEAKRAADEAAKASKRAAEVAVRDARLAKERAQKETVVLHMAAKARAAAVRAEAMRVEATRVAAEIARVATEAARIKSEAARAKADAEAEREKNHMMSLQKKRRLRRTGILIASVGSMAVLSRVWRWRRR